MTGNKGRALIAMSGGVDSSAAALLMRQEGWDCVGATMLLGQDGSGDAEEARETARRLGIPFHVFDFREEFSRQVIDRFVRAYARGETPNPCVDCNRYLKFGAFLRMAEELDCVCAATGHYARIARAEDGSYLLKRARDPGKDQSYVLSCLTQAQLARVRFPLGDYTKQEARELAARAGLACANRQDSQDLCFVPDGDYAAFLERRAGTAGEPGNFVLEDGTVVGRHRGIAHYTNGQRRGLGVAWRAPLYVLRRDTARNEVVLAENEALFTRELKARDVHWIAGAPPRLPLRCTAVTRYQAKETPCTVSLREDGTLYAEPDTPIRAVTPGQTLVLYDGDTVLGCGTLTD